MLCNLHGIKKYFLTSPNEVGRGHEVYPGGVVGTDWWGPDRGAASERRRSQAEHQGHSQPGSHSSIAQLIGCSQETAKLNRMTCLRLMIVWGVS